jgi:hypothetical protein
MEIRKVLIGVVLVILAYVLYNYFRNENDKVLFGQRDGRVLLDIDAKKAPTTKTLDYTYSIWFYINDWNYRYGETKVLFGREDRTGGNPCPSVSFTPSVNNLNIALAYKKASTVSVENCNIDNIPLQKWTHLLISQNNRAVDVYIDGKLVKTCVLPGVPNVDVEKPIIVTPDGGFAGYVASFRLLGHAVAPLEAYNIYKEGYGGSSLLDKYKVKMSLLKDDSELKSFEL